MDDIKIETFINVVEKIKKRDELQRHFYRNEVDIDRLHKINKEITEQIQSLDRTILSMVKPKEEKNGKGSG